MVEGPGCKVKCESMKPKVVGQKVNNVSGQVVSKTKNGSKLSQNVPLQNYSSLTNYCLLVGCFISDVKTLGKELFIFFTDLEFCLRVHFLMNGSYRLNQTGVNTENGGSKNHNQYELVLHLTTGDLAFHMSSVAIRSSIESLEKIQNMISLDICSTDFNHSRSVSLFIQQQDRLICDVLLDQNIFPGIGNIIKNEALFDSGLKPDTKVRDLDEKHISHLVKMTRDFSMLFYKCRRNGKQLSKFYKIYNKTTCKQCDGKVVTTRMGEDIPRITSFCSNCQTNDLSKLEERSLPSKNSLLGWITKKSKDEVKKVKTTEWTCVKCTFCNPRIRSKCQMCFSLKFEVEEENCSTSFSSEMTSPKTSSQNTHAVTNKPAGETNNEMSFNIDLIEVISENVMDNIGTSRASGKGMKRKFDEITNFEPNQTNKHIKFGALNSKATKKSLLPEPPLCPQHKTKCNMREVHKKGENLHRMFWSCPARGKCSFFQWADFSFPYCEGHGKRAVLRTVLKQGVNNGRKFFACPKEKHRQCGFFLWAEEL